MGALRRLGIVVAFALSIGLVDASFVRAESPAALTGKHTMFDLSRAETENVDKATSNALVGSMVPNKSDLLGRAVSGILYSVGLFGLLLMGYRRFRPNQQRSVDDIRVISRKALTQRAQLVIVEVENKRLLLSLTNENLSLVTELSPASWDQVIGHDDVMLAEEMIHADELGSAYAQGGR